MSLATNTTYHERSRALHATKFSPAAAGAFAGLCEALSMHWTTTLRICSQLEKPYPTTVAGWWKGGTYNLAAMMPFFITMSAVKNAMSEHYKEKNGGSLTATHQVTIAGVSAVCATAVMNPLDMVFTQMRVQEKEIPAVIKSIYDQAGVRGFYKQIALTAVRNAPYCIALQVWTPNLAQKMTKVMPAAWEQDTKKSVAVVAAATVAGTASGVVTQPLDNVRTRLFARPISAPKERFGQAAQAMYRQGGVRIFFRSLVPRLIRVGPGSGVVAAAFEVVQLVNNKNAMKN